MSDSRPDPAEVIVRHDPDGPRFVTSVAGVEGVVEYHLEGDVMVITHTSVPEAIGGRGIAGKLNRKAFEHARDEGLKVRPGCTYTAAWAKRHPEFDDLLT